VVVPVGAVTYLGASGAWDWATGGLENGLSLAWLGGAMWAVVALLAASTPTRRRLVATSALVGLGVLVRPDLAVFTVGLAPAVAVAARRRGGRRSVAAAAAAALAVPAVVQVCRMGYYAQVVPTSVTAKEGMQPSWRNGLDYLADFATASHLVVPLAVVLAWLAASWRGAGRDWRLVVAGIEVAAAAHTLGIVRAGGDYMHARLLLPAWFAALLPVFAVRLAGGVRAASTGAARRGRAAGVAVLAAWVVVAAGWLRPDGSHDIRTGLLAVTTPHPVTAGDIVARQPFLGYASTLGDRPGFHEQGLGGTVVTTPSADGRSVTSTEVLGIVGYTAPVDVVVHDRLGLADPVTAHLALDRRGRPGHEKMLPGSWIAALFVAPGARVPGDFEQPDGMAAFLAGVDVVRDPARFATERAAATDALGCGELAELLHDTRAPLTPGRFLGNIADAPRLHGFRFPVDPEEARARLCS
jgi:arabinofuranosyltransferase